MEVKFEITEKVFYLNTVTGVLDCAEVRGVRIVPTGIHPDEEGKNVLDGYAVLYETVDGPTLAESECFGSREEAVAAWKERFEKM